MKAVPFRRFLVISVLFCLGYADMRGRARGEDVSRLETATLWCVPMMVLEFFQKSSRA
jgi:hypothetical protein